MIARRFVFMLLLCQLGFVGCQHRRCHTLWNNVCRTVKREPKCFDYCDRSAVFHEMACCYWSKNMRSEPCSDHFRGGFLDGFADYLHRGGTGQAPVLPPRQYWEPAGGMARLNVIEEWRTGFQAGAESAKESGMREQVVISYDGLPVSGQSTESVQPAAYQPTVIENSSIPTQMQYTDMPVPSESEGQPYAYEVIEEEKEVGAEPSENSILTLPHVQRHSSPEPTIIHLSDDDALGE